MKNLHFRLSLALLCLVIQVGPARLSTNLLLWLTEQQMILMVFSFFFEREKREVVVIMSLQKYVLPFEHAQASEYLHCSGKSPSLGLKVKFHFLFAIVWRVKIAGKLCFRQWMCCFLIHHCFLKRSFLNYGFKSGEEPGLVLCNSVCWWSEGQSQGCAGQPS